MNLRQKHIARAAALLVTSAVAFVLCGNAVAGSVKEEEGLWKSLRTGGHFVLIRHAIAPGMCDPPEFTIDNCQTQRNLSAEGRTQAANIGALFRANGIQQARVFSSQWCRCLETAQLLALGTVQELPLLNSFYRNMQDSKSQTRRLQEWLQNRNGDQPLVMVTHQVNITALTDVFPSSGELVIVHQSTDGKLSVVGTIETN